MSISVNRPYTEKVKPPRSIYLHWPFGHPLGEPGRADQHAAVLNKAFEALYAIETPGQIIDVGWPWRRKVYPQQPWRQTKAQRQTIKCAHYSDCLPAGPATN